MSEQTNPVPEPTPAQESGLKRTVRTVGTGLGCLVLLVIAVIVFVGVLAIFLDEPTLWIAVVALLVAVAAYKASKRGR